MSDDCWPPVPRLWPGETVAIAAGGPSLTQEQLDYVKGKARLIVVNNAYKLAPWADILYACDFNWWKAYQPDFSGIKISEDAQVLTEMSGVMRVPSVAEPGLSMSPERLHQGNNGGYQALNLAVLTGANKILLLGYDMKWDADGRSHWHGSHPNSLPNPRPANFRHWIQNYETTLPDLERAGVEVINCSPDTALTCYPRLPIEDVL